MKKESLALINYLSSNTSSSETAGPNSNIPKSYENFLNDRKNIEPSRIGSKVGNLSGVGQSSETANISPALARVYPNQFTLAPSLIHLLKEVQRELVLFCSKKGTENKKNASQRSKDQDNKNVDDSVLQSQEAILNLVQETAAKLGLELTNYERDQVLAYLESSEKPFGILQDLVNNSQISDIIVSSYDKIAVQQGRKNYLSDLAFPSQEAYEHFVERLLQRAQTTYSTKKPIADGMIGSFARVHVVHKSLCESGPYLTIRLNRFSSVQIKNLLKFGLAPIEVFDYLRILVQAGCTVLVVGEVATGKTTLVRALAATIPADESLLVIEDTPEIQLEHAHVRYVRTREANIEGAGRITPGECIRASMRMAMNRIIFGEMRDAEAAEAFIDVCASGHPGLSTIHARSTLDALTRLELFLGRAQKGVESTVLKSQIVTAVQIIVYVDICSITQQRRIMEVREIGAVADGVIRTKEIFKYDPQDGTPLWRVVNKVSQHRDLLERGSSNDEDGDLNLSAYNNGGPGYSSRFAGSYGISDNKKCLKLHTLANHLELDLGVAYREAASQNNRAY